MTPKPVSAVLNDGSAIGTWELDASGSSVTILAKSMWGLVRVRGGFGELSGSGRVASDGSITGRLVIKAESIDTRNKKRDTHLGSADFFDATEHPDITLTVTSVGIVGDGELRVTGELEAAGNRQPASFTARVAELDETSVTLDATFTIDRTAFGMTWNPMRVSSGPVAASASLHFTLV